MVDHSPIERPDEGIVGRVGRRYFSFGLGAHVVKYTFILIHGAWHGGWCWQRVAKILQQAGHTVLAPTLSGVGERSHLAGLDINLTTHVLDVVNEVTWKDLSNIVLCGHSYGGMVITGAAEHIRERIASIVYLDAFVPNDRESLNDVAGVEWPATGMIPPMTAEQLNVNAADRAWVDSRLTPQAGACFSEKLSLTGAAFKVPKKAYIQATACLSPAFQSACERLARTPGWKTHMVDCGHDVMIDRPAELAELLMMSA
jgi:pimeloyl-ACP methyl ester carboxylesterase